MNINTNSVKKNVSSFFGIKKKVPKENRLAKLPDEILLNIFRFVPGQIRLEILPTVCSKFANLNRPFAKKCFPLYHLIPPSKQIVTRRFETGTLIYSLNFKENQELILGKIMFGDCTKKIAQLSKS